MRCSTSRALVRVSVGISIEAADTHECTIDRAGLEQHLALAIEAVRAAEPLLDEAPDVRMALRLAGLGEVVDTAWQGHDAVHGDERIAGRRQERSWRTTR